LACEEHKRLGTERSPDQKPDHLIDVRVGFTGPQQQPNKRTGVLSATHGRPPTDRAGSPVLYLARENADVFTHPPPRAKTRDSPVVVVASLNASTYEKSTIRHIARCHLVAEHFDELVDGFRCARCGIPANVVRCGLTWGRRVLARRGGWLGTKPF
jgi:hypothetical protein